VHHHPAVDPITGPIFSAHTIPEKPSTASVVIHADSDQQLTNILLALSNAVQLEHSAASRQPKEQAAQRGGPARPAARDETATRRGP